VRGAPAENQAFCGTNWNVRLKHGRAAASFFGLPLVKLDDRHHYG
jgi:hypothetical protein